MGFNITEAPKCVDMSREWCLNMTRLKGLVVYLYRYRNSSFYKIVRHNQTQELPYGLKDSGVLDECVLALNYHRLQNCISKDNKSFAEQLQNMENRKKLKVEELSPATNLASVVSPASSRMSTTVEVNRFGAFAPPVYGNGRFSRCFQALVDNYITEGKYEKFNGFKDHVI
jgi:hypothetical protein